MITDTGQMLMAIAVVAAALAYVSYRVYRALTGKGNAGCGTCSSCPASQSGAGTRKPLVMLQGPFNAPKDG